jgi:hypothetical protein
MLANHMYINSEHFFIPTQLKAIYCTCCNLPNIHHCELLLQNNKMGRHVACIGERRGAFRVLVGKPKG